MNRRQFLKRTVRNGASLTTGFVAGSLARGKEAGTEAGRKLKSLDRRIRGLGDRIDRLEAGQKRLLRAGLLFAGISTGLDLTLLM